MDNYIKKLRKYIAANLIRFDDDCDHPGKRSFRKNDRVFSLVGTLCANMTASPFWLKSNWAHS